VRAAIAQEPEYADNYYDLGYILKLCDDAHGASEAYRLYVSVRTRRYIPFKHVLAGSVVGPEDGVGVSVPVSEMSSAEKLREQSALLNSSASEAERLHSAEKVASAN
jgi:hypothetical protein